MGDGIHGTGLSLRKDLVLAPCFKPVIGQILAMTSVVKFENYQIT